PSYIDTFPSPTLFRSNRMPRWDLDIVCRGCRRNILLVRVLLKPLPVHRIRNEARPTLDALNRGSKRLVVRRLVNSLGDSCEPLLDRKSTRLNSSHVKI